MARPKKEPNKVCPVCEVKHAKRGPYCSKVCSNKGRTVTDEQKKKTSESMTKFMNSDDDRAEEARWRINNYEKETDAVVVGRQFDQTYLRDGNDLWFYDD